MSEFKIDEEVLLTEYSEYWKSQMPVKLFKYSDKAMDVHCQTGDHHTKAIEKARKILWKRGLAVGPAELIGGTGIYYPVKQTIGID